MSRLKDIIRYAINKETIDNERKEEDKQYNEVLEQIYELKKDLQLMTLSRDRYLENCRKKTAEIKELKKKIKESKNGKGSV